MSVNHLASVLLTLLYYGLLGLSLFGWGKILFSLLNRKGHFGKDPSWIMKIWTGWAGTLLLFQIIHFSLPLNIYSAGPVFAVGLAVALISIVQYRGQYKAVLSAATIGAMPFILIGMTVLVLWIISRAMYHPTNYDSGLYHFSTVKWINSYPIIPGLGNLHGRLAFNQSFLTFVAALNLYPFFGHGRSVANSFLLILIFITVLRMLHPLIRQPNQVDSLPVVKWLPPLMSLPILAYWGISSNNVPSPSPDLTVDLLQLLIFMLFCRLLGHYMEEGKLPRKGALLLFLLLATAITVKLSSIMFCSVIGVLVIAAVLKHPGHRLRDAAFLLLPPALILLVWCLRGIILSGVPLFPSTIGYTGADWAVPLNKIVEEADKIVGWARQPWTHHSEVLGSWDWFPGWLKKRMGHYGTTVLFPVGAFLVLSLIGILTGFRGREENNQQSGSLLWVLPLPLLVGLVFWFFKAPDPRFALPLFQLLPVAPMVPLLTFMQKRLPGRPFILATVALVIASNLNYAWWMGHNPGELTRLSVDGWMEVHSVPIKPQTTLTGLRVYTPVERDQCWDGPLPCTPYFNPFLGLREPGNLASGFRDYREAAMAEK